MVVDLDPLLLAEGLNRFARVDFASLAYNGPGDGDQTLMQREGEELLTGIPLDVEAGAGDEDLKRAYIDAPLAVLARHHIAARVPSLDRDVGARRVGCPNPRTRSSVQPTPR